MKTKWTIIVGGAALLVAIIALTGWGYVKFRLAHDLAVGELEDYLGDMYPDRAVMGISCSGTDTDDNGYISCEGRVSGPKEHPERVEVIALECSRAFFSGGCKRSMLPIGAVIPTAAP